LAHSGCTQHEGALFGSQDENETREENAHQPERPSQTSESDVANTPGVSSYGREDREHTEQRDTERQAGGESGNDAYTDSEGLERRWSQCELRESQEEGQTGWSQWWQSEPNVGRVAHGVPKRVDRLKSLGNSLVPMIPYYIGMSIKKGDMLWTK